MPRRGGGRFLLIDRIPYLPLGFLDTVAAMGFVVLPSYIGPCRLELPLDLIGSAD